MADQAFSRAAGRAPRAGQRRAHPQGRGREPIRPGWRPSQPPARASISSATSSTTTRSAGASRTRSSRARAKDPHPRDLRLAGRARPYRRAVLAAPAERRESRCGASIPRAWTSRWAGWPATTASRSRSTAGSPSSPASASAGCGRAIPRRTSPPGATPASRSAARRWRTSARAFAEAWAACGEPLPEEDRNRPVPAQGGRRAPARGGRHLGHGRPLPARSPGGGPGPQHAVADRRLLRGDALLRAGPGGGRA
jgi:hypothetical protein